MKDFFDDLRHRLTLDLPGMEAQRLMIPGDSLDERFNLDREDARLGGVMVLFYQQDDEICLPLIQRHDYEGTHGGQVSFPGGKWEEGDIDLVDTALRETFEEIGVHRSEIDVLGKLTDLYIPPSNVRVSPVVGVIRHEPSFDPDPYEVREMIEVPLSLLIRNATIKRTNIPVCGMLRMDAPFFDVSGKIVWGATAMMLSELLAVVREIRPNL